MTSACPDPDQPFLPPREDEAASGAAADASAPHAVPNAVPEEDAGPDDAINRNPPVDVDTRTACAAWLDLYAEIGAMSGQWARLEHDMARRSKWRALHRRGGAAGSGVGALADIDVRLSAAHRESEALLRRLATLPAADPPTIAAKLAVAVTALAPEDHIDVYRLLESILLDVSAL